MNEDTNQQQNTSDDGGNQQQNTSNVLHIIGAIAIAVFVFYASADRIPARFGLLFAAISFILSVIGAYIGIKIGDFLRRIALPDAVWTGGGMLDILKTKLFWAIGPQTIGGCIGAVIGLLLLYEIFK